MIESVIYNDPGTSRETKNEWIFIEDVIKIDPGTSRDDARTSRETKNERILIEDVIKIDPGTSRDDAGTMPCRHPRTLMSSIVWTGDRQWDPVPGWQVRRCDSGGLTNRKQFGRASSYEQRPRAARARPSEPWDGQVHHAAPCSTLVDAWLASAPISGARFGAS